MPTFFSTRRLVPWILNRFVRIIPLEYLSRSSEVLRETSKHALLNCERFRVFEFSEGVEFISFDHEEDKIAKGDLSEAHVIFFIHGGGFIIRDCADIIIGERLLPMVNERAGTPPVVIVSLLYPLARLINILS